MKKTIACILLILAFLSSPCFGQRWAFVAIGDNRAAFSAYRNVLEEIRDQRANPYPRFPAADFVVACGDLSPVAENYEIYESVFGDSKPFFFPVRGNHENPADVRFIFDRLLLPFAQRIQLRDRQGVNYYVDWKNARLIVLDQYSDFNDTLDNDAALQWVKAAIDSAAGADHVFVAFHEPIVAGEPPSAKFWRALVERKSKVKAVFAGHLHFFRHERVPDEPAGIDFINIGNSGQVSHSDNKQTIVNVLVDGDRVSYRVVQALDQTRDFKLTKQW